MKAPQFEIHKIYQEEALRIQSARRSAKIIHAAGDIPASGDEVEFTFRSFLQRRLPSRFHVGHGHIVDKDLKVSPQLDVVISDGNACPILFEGERRTKFYPYESVYAIGEVKTTFSRSKEDIKNFAKTRQWIQNNLTREKTPPNYLGEGVTLGSGISLDGADPEYRNRMFSFMVFADSGDASRKSLLSEIATSADKYLPNVSCFLDGSVICKGDLKFTGKDQIEANNYVMNSRLIETDLDLFWTKLDFQNQGLGGGYALAHLTLGLFEHLNGCVLMRPPIHEYMQQMQKDAQISGRALDIRFVEKMGLQLPPNWKETIDEIIDQLDE